jgi:hyperosmotically inducible protein
MEELAMKFIKHSYGKRIGTAACSVLLLTAVAAAPALAGAGQSKSSAWEGAAHDAWIDGKIEALFTVNRYLNPFRIDTQVNDGVVVLSGDVESRIDKELAGEIARGTEGVEKVVNNLEVMPGSRAPGKGSRGVDDYVADATMTAQVKYALIASDSTDGLSIDVDTSEGKVTLKGNVDSMEQKELAGRIARNVDGVSAVNNLLKVQS